MNIGETFCSYILTLYRDVSSRVIINGWISRKIYPTRRVQQGCPLSPILYVLVAETPSSSIKNSSITGLQLPHTHRVLKVAQYADDTTVVTTSDRDFRILQECIFLSRCHWGTTEYLQVQRSVCRSLQGPHRPAHVVDDR